MPPESEPKPDFQEANSPEPSTESRRKRSPTTFQKLLQQPWNGRTVQWFGITALVGLSHQFLLSIFGFDFRVLTWAGGVAGLVWVFSLLMAVLAFFISHPPGDAEIQKRLMKRGGLLCGGAVILSAISMLSPAIQSARQAATNAQGNVFVERTFANGRFSVRVPQSWKPTENSEPQAGVLQLSDPQNEVQLVAYAVHHADVPVKTLSELQRLEVKDMSESLNNVKSEIVMDRKWATPAEIETVLTGSTESMNYWYLLRLAEYGDYWVEIRFWAMPSRLDHHGELIAQIADSLQPLTTDSQ